jgi:hypothetical protein
MAQLKDLLVAGDARVIGESSFNDKVTVAGLLTLSGGFSVNSNTTTAGTVKYILGVKAFSSNVGSVVYQDVGNIVVGSASKVENALTINGKTYDGGKAIDVGTIGVSYGGTGLTSAPSLLVNLGSTTAASIFTASPRPGITGTLGIAHGGTGMTSATSNRLVWTTSSTAMTAGYHYADNTHIGVGYTSSTAPSYTLYVGTSNGSAGTLGVSSTLEVLGDTNSTNKSTGALKVAGGAGIKGQMSANTVMVADKTTLRYNSTYKALEFVF